MSLKSLAIAQQAERLSNTSLNSQKVFIQYVNADLFTVWLKPVGSRWVFYNIAKYSDIPTNVDVWRIRSAYVSDLNVESPIGSMGANRVNPLLLTNENSQWEYAIRPQGAPDFMGGFHGDEILQNVLFLADGKAISLQGLECSHFEMVQDTKIYNPTDGTTELADLNIRHIWTPEGLNLKMEINWTSGVTLDSAYFSMIPLLRGDALTSRLRYADTAIEHNIGSSGHAIAGRNTYGVDIYNHTTKLGINAELESDWFNGYANTDRGVWVSDAAQYNKVYMTRVNDSMVTVPAGDVWRGNSKIKVWQGEN